MNTRDMSIKGHKFSIIDGTFTCTNCEGQFQSDLTGTRLIEFMSIFSRCESHDAEIYADEKLERIMQVGA